MNSHPTVSAEPLDSDERHRRVRERVSASLVISGACILLVAWIASRI